MNSDANNANIIMDEIEDDFAGSNSDASSTSTSSSRAERLRHERTQRHRQRLQRAKQFHEQREHQQQQQELQQQQQQQQTNHRRSSSESSGSTAASSLARRGLESRGRVAGGSAAAAAVSNASLVAPPATAHQQQQQLRNQEQRQQQPVQQRQQKYGQNSSQNNSLLPQQPQQPISGKIESHRSSPSMFSPKQSNKKEIAASTESQPANSATNNAPPIPSPKAPSSKTSMVQHQPPHHHSHQPPPYQQTPSSSSHRVGPVLVSVESPLPPLVQRSLGDRSYDKRKNAALEIEQLVKSLNEAHNVPMISSIIAVLAKDFCTSMNANYRKGGLIGIAATAIGLMGNTRSHLEGLIFPVLHCFDDPESRVRYYACESLYNIAKVARGSILRYFNQIFDGLTKLFADVDVDVKNGADLLDRLVKDIVTESETFHVEHFLPLLTTYIRRTNPFIRQLLVGWITVLDSIPDLSMIDYLPNFLDGLFNMLSDSNREIRQAADSALADFLKEVRHAAVIEFGPLVSILVNQSLSKDRLNRLTAITWIEELIHHPYSGGDALLPHHAEVLGAILYCISDSEEQICLVAERTNADLLSLVKETRGDFRLAPLLETLTEKITTKDDVPTKMACLRWINMLLEKRRGDMAEFISQLLPVLLKTLSDASDAVVLFTLQVLARISLGDGGGPLLDELDNRYEIEGKDDNIHGGLLRGQKDEKHFKLVINAILGLFASDRMLLENRGSLVVRKLCVLLDAESVYMLMAQVLSFSCEISPKEGIFFAEDIENGPSCADGDTGDTPVKFSMEFISTIVQTLNLILLTANELHGLRVLLANAFEFKDRDFKDDTIDIPADKYSTKYVKVFETLFRCWCHSPVATFSLCLLARTYEVAFALVQKFSELEVTVGKGIFVHVHSMSLHD
jgi:vacuole morphology and inheritance protein 14